MLIQLLPAGLSPWIPPLIVLLVLALDFLAVLAIIALAALLVAFKAGKLAYDTIDRIVGRLIYTALCMAEDALESPPLNRIPFFQFVLVGVKKAYDLINGAQKLIEFIVNGAVTVSAIAAMAVLLLGLAAVNVAALWFVIHYPG